MVSLFMFLSYGPLGLVADSRAYYFGLITLALYKLIPVTLTLPELPDLCFLLEWRLTVTS